MCFNTHAHRWYRVSVRIRTERARKKSRFDGPGLASLFSSSFFFFNTHLYLVTHMCVRRLSLCVSPSTIPLDTDPGSWPGHSDPADSHQPLPPAKALSKLQLTTTTITRENWMYKLYETVSQTDKQLNLTD